ncbi:MAG: excinuclease ABC subunit UvrC [Syntrophorhabdaceae bacterium]|nr:excinuclease ABC subunit UvrC [Syntrophorhabdaceae bacterium]
MLNDRMIENLPESPGVYIFKDREGRIVYVGKAKNIKDRVKSYTRDELKDPKTRQLIKSIEALDFFITANEKEAFLLENNLIKEHGPKYNINLKDDKTYISLKVTMKDRFPGLYITRKIEDDGALYFGPYPHAKDVRDVIRLVQTLYPVRRCKDSTFRKRKRPCILYDIKRCLAPCTGAVDEKTYREMVGELTEILAGRAEGLLKRLGSEIERLSSEWKFEEAAILKNRYFSIKGMVERQSVHEHLGKDRHVWAFLEGSKGTEAVLLIFRKGVLISKKHFKNALIRIGWQEAIPSFLFRYYSERPVPDEIILSEAIEERQFLESYLSDKKGQRVKIAGPDGRGVKDLLRLAIENLYGHEAMDHTSAFRERLNLKVSPKRIEVYDCSHTSGANPVGVMVVFEDFKVNKGGYRVFHIRDAPPGDDVAAISEVIGRRVRDERLGPLPDLFIIDGGKGQLMAALKALKAQGIDRDVLAIAKGERRRVMDDVIYLPNRKNPLILPGTSPVFKELVKMRDEAHRFAISSHRRRKRREDMAR